MTKKDYELVARVLYKHKLIVPLKAFEVVVFSLAREFQLKNDRFDFQKFVKACYGK